MGVEHPIHLGSHPVGLILERCKELGEAIIIARRLGMHRVDGSIDGETERGDGRLDALLQAKFKV